jgi:hypothetical protein
MSDPKPESVLVSLFPPPEMVTESPTMKPSVDTTDKLVAPGSTGSGKVVHVATFAGSASMAVSVVAVLLDVVRLVAVSVVVAEAFAMLERMFPDVLVTVGLPRPVVLVPISVTVVILALLPLLVLLLDVLVADVEADGAGVPGLFDNGSHGDVGDVHMLVPGFCEGPVCNGAPNTSLLSITVGASLL